MLFDKAKNFSTTLTAIFFTITMTTENGKLLDEKQQSDNFAVLIKVFPDNDTRGKVMVPLKTSYCILSRYHKYP